MDIFVDVDNVVALPDDNTEGPSDYTKASPIEGNIVLVNELYESGHRITYYTARGTETGRDWRQTTLSQLEEWGCKFHDLRMGKPAFDMLIDDKAYNVDRLKNLIDSLT